MYWFALKRITPVVSAALVESGSLISSPGVAPEIIVSAIDGARFAGVEPSQFVKLVFTGMVLLNLKTLVPSVLSGGKTPPVLKFTVTPAVATPESPSSSCNADLPV